MEVIGVVIMRNCLRKFFEAFRYVAPFLPPLIFSFTGAASRMLSLGVQLGDFSKCDLFLLDFWTIVLYLAIFPSVFYLPRSSNWCWEYISYWKAFCYSWLTLILWVPLGFIGFAVTSSVTSVRGSPILDLVVKAAFPYLRVFFAAGVVWLQAAAAITMPLIKYDTLYPFALWTSMLLIPVLATLPVKRASRKAWAKRDEAGSWEKGLWKAHISMDVRPQLSRGTYKPEVEPKPASPSLGYRLKWKTIEEIAERYRKHSRDTMAKIEEDERQAKQLGDREMLKKLERARCLIKSAQKPSELPSKPRGEETTGYKSRESTAQEIADTALCSDKKKLDTLQIVETIKEKSEREGKSIESEKRKRARREDEEMMRREKAWEELTSLQLFDDVVGLEEAKKALVWGFLVPLLFPERVEGASPRGGLMLYGPPGTGKTDLLRVVAEKVRIPLIEVKPSDIESKWVGESEQRIAALFQEARKKSGCIFFFDEAEGIFARRAEWESSHRRTMLAQLLSEIDGLNSQKQRIFVVACTNKPWEMDPATFRPGRFGKMVYVPPPNTKERSEVFKRHMRDKKTAGEINCERLAELTKCETGYYSGADIAEICRLASLEAAKNGTAITMEMLEEAIAKANPSILPIVVKWFEDFQNNWLSKRKAQTSPRRRESYIS